MEIYRLLQIGDVHYLDVENSTVPIDLKDKGFPSRISANIGVPPLQAVCRQFTRLLEDDSLNAITFMGDYTTRGDAVGLSQCLEYLKRQIPTAWLANATRQSVSTIGNHDIARVTAGTANSRFDDVNRELIKFGFPTASVDDPTLVEWAGNQASVKVFGVNSCVGCGETRYIPDLIKPTVSKALSDLINLSADPSIIDQLIESIDTPAVSENSIQYLTTSISALGNDTIPFICAHHNLLPQSTPRIAPYSELINGGSIRSALISLNRPIIFLHGHIHQDPCEIIRSPIHRRANLVSISAPLLRDGFNVIEVYFSKAGFPLGINVIPYRREGNSVEKKSTIEIPLWPILVGLEHATRDCRNLIGMINAGVDVYYSDLFRTSNLTEEEFSSAMQELRWLGIIEIKNPLSKPEQWRITRAI